MLRALLLAAALAGTAKSECRGCDFDLTVLEVMTVDFQAVTYFQSFENPRFATTGAPYYYYDYSYGYYDDYGYEYYDVYYDDYDYGYSYGYYSYGYSYGYGYNYYATALASQNQNATILASHNQTRRLQLSPYRDTSCDAYCDTAQAVCLDCRSSGCYDCRNYGYYYDYSYGYYDDYDDYGHDYYDMTFNPYYSYDYYDVYTPPPPPPQVVVNFETAQLPQTMPAEHGQVAVDARNMQVKLDSHAFFPAGFVFGDGYNSGPDAVNLPLGGDSGVQIHEEMHINGQQKQASYHMESPVLNLCFLLDLPSTVSLDEESSMVDQYLEQAEQVGPMMMQQYGTHAYVNGEPAMGFVGSNPSVQPDYSVAPSVLFTNSSQPALITQPMPSYVAEDLQRNMQPAPDVYLLEHLAVKYDNYVNSVGDAFAVRACAIESQSATQSVLASNPKARDFVMSRVAQHEAHLQALLKPGRLNTRFNFMPLEISDSMFPVQQPCTPEQLAQIPSTPVSSFQMVLFAIGSFAMGTAGAFAVLRMKPASSGDEYHHVSA